MIEDAKELVPTSMFPGLKYKFPLMNPFQSAYVPYHNQDCNVVCAARTGAGKSLIAEITFFHEVCENGGHVIYLAPMKSLVKEKFDDWTKPDHAFADCGVSMVTGDYQLTPKRQEEMNVNHVKILTSEMLDSRTRRMQVENNAWLHKVKVIVVDEAHIIGMCNEDQEPLQERGHRLEAALIRFTKINKTCRIILLSATLPNIAQLGEWLTKLNGKKTETIVSTYVPQPLNWHISTYPEADWKKVQGAYHLNKARAMQNAIDIVKQYPEDMFCLFCHSKTDGKQLQKKLSDELGVAVPFHSADLGKEERITIEKAFKGREINHTIATSTLAYGINMPARRVIILDITRGLNNVHPYDIKQMGGRAGRPGIDPAGDVYLIASDKQAHQAQRTIDTMPDAESLMFNPDVFAFHIVAEIAEGDISTKEQVFEYYRRSLACHQNKLVDEKWFADLVDKLIKCEVLKQNPDGTLAVTALGRISSWLYFSPFDIYGWANNMRKVFAGQRKDDFFLAWMLMAVRNNYMDYIPKDCQPNWNQFANQLKDVHTEGYEVAIMACYYQLQGNWKNVPGGCIAKQRQLAFDMERVQQALALIDSMYLKAGKSDSIKLLSTRVKYGCGWDAAKLCMLPSIGAKRAKLLIDNGILNLEDLKKKEKLGTKLLGDKIYNKAIYNDPVEEETEELEEVEA